jgi:anaerobic selenocysteine-containing dehydrogenase
LVERFAGYVDQTEPGLVATPRRAMRRMNSTMSNLGRGGEDAEIWVNPADAVGINHGDRIIVRSQAGSIEGPARVTDDVVVGAISTPHGLAAQNVNLLTSGAPGYVDDFTGMVRQSGIPVTIESRGRRE